MQKRCYYWQQGSVAVAVAAAAAAAAEDDMMSKCLLSWTQQIFQSAECSNEVSEYNV
jgi:hypothetical protein